jgi:hypothetical protein
MPPYVCGMNLTLPIPMARQIMARLRSLWRQLSRLLPIIKER